jgi:urease gamma subunit
MASSVVQQKLTPAEVRAAVAMYVRRQHEAKHLPVPDEAALIATVVVDYIRDGVPVIVPFENVFVTYEV